jgi:[ribosomal protein S5]-alanine N-acetyltransferase
MPDTTEHPIFFPTLETERLILRQLTFEDTDFIFQHFSDPQVTEYLMDEPPLTDSSQAQEIIRFFMEPEGKTQNRWGMIRKTDQRLIGTCGFHKWDKERFRTEMGYDLTPACWGQGYMTEALRAMISSGFERMALNRIDAMVYVDNPRSYKLLEKLGFKREGVLRDYFCLDGIFYDHLIYSLLRREWKK